MLRVDTHYHASPHWWEPVEVFLFHMDRTGVDKGVLIQMLGEFDNSYLVEATRRFPGRLSAVALVDPSDTEAASHMEHWADEGVDGFRMSLSDPATLGEPRALWRKAEQLGSLVSVVGTTEQFASERFKQTIREVPSLPIIIEHLGVLGTLQTSGHGGINAVPKPPYSTYRGVLELARHPNVYVKVTGFSEYMPKPSVFRGRPFDLSQAPPFIDMCIEAFGADRMMVGTDPSSSCREGYANVWNDLAEYLGKFSRDEQEAVLGRTANRLFRFGRTET